MAVILYKTNGKAEGGKKQKETVLIPFHLKSMLLPKVHAYEN